MSDIDKVVIRASKKYAIFSAAGLGIVCLQMAYYILGFALEGDTAGVIMFGLIGVPIFLVEIWFVYLIYSIVENLTLDNEGVHYKSFSKYILGYTIPWKGIETVTSKRMGNYHYIFINIKPSATADSYHAGKFHELIYGKPVMMSTNSLANINDRELIEMLESYRNRYGQ